MSKIMRELYAEARGDKRRFSCIEGDAGYANYRDALLRGKTCAVYCDGRRLEHAVIADETLGQAVVLKYPFVLTPDGHDVERATIQGAICVELV